MFKFATLDPHSVSAATEANEKVFASGPVFGIEVTVPALAARCITNLDPQHGPTGSTNMAAIEAAIALTGKLPPEGTVLATVRADLDSVGAMAVFVMRARGVLDPGQGAWERIRLVANADKFARGGYPGPRPLPTKDNPWPEESSSAESMRPLAAIAAAVADFKIPLADRVALMEHWLLTGEEPEQYRGAVEKERLDLIGALEKEQIKVETRQTVVAWNTLTDGVVPGFHHPEGYPDAEPIYGTIAVVETTHRAATRVGYCLAPVVVAANPSFRVQGGEPHLKFTVCQYEAGHVDLAAVLSDLKKLEAEWGGSLTIIGSTQGVASPLTIGQVVEVVTKHLKS